MTVIKNKFSNNKKMENNQDDQNTPNYRLPDIEKQYKIKDYPFTQFGKRYEQNYKLKQVSVDKIQDPRIDLILSNIRKCSSKELDKIVLALSEIREDRIKYNRDHPSNHIQKLQELQKLKEEVKKLKQEARRAIISLPIAKDL